VLIGNELNKEAFGESDLEQYLGRLEVQNLNLNLYANKIGAEGANLLSSALRNKLSLKSLHLDLYFNNIT